MDARSFLSHLNSRRPVLAMATPVGMTTTGMPLHHASAAPTSRASVTAPSLPAARPQGLAGKPPYSKDRYPASFVGRPAGAKSKAPGRRQMYAALASAVAMRSGDSKLEADATASDFLEKFGVKRAVITRLTNALSSGDMTMHQAMSTFVTSAERAGHPVGGFATTMSSAPARPPARAAANPDAPLPTEGAYTAEGDRPQMERRYLRDARREREALAVEETVASRTARNRAPPGQMSTAGGALPGGEVPSTVPTAAVIAPVSTEPTPRPSLPSGAGAGDTASSNGPGIAESAFPDAFDPLPMPPGPESYAARNTATQRRAAMTGRN